MVKQPYLDTTFLAFGGDRRGVPQVILQLVRFCLENKSLNQIRFIAIDGKNVMTLKEYGVPESRIETLTPIPFIGKFERMHGLFSTFRYRKILRKASWVFHTELRTVAWTKVKQIVLLYDFIIFYPKEIQGKVKRDRQLTYYLANLIAQNVHYKIAISNATRLDALRLFPKIEIGTIKTVPIGVRLYPVENPKLSPGIDLSLTFLYVGAYDHRKNILNLVKHFLELIPVGRTATLHLVGKIPDKTRDHFEKIAGSWPSFASLKISGLLNEDDLLKAYDDAHFLTFPSLFEGFGLPILEAMARGLPVLAFSNSSLPEIGGSAAILTENNDFKGWALRILELTNKPDNYKEASSQGLLQTTKYSEDAMRLGYTKYFLEMIESPIEKIKNPC